MLSSQKTTFRFALGFAAVIQLGVFGLLFYGFQETPVHIQYDKISFGGLYRETVVIDDITHFALVIKSELPEMKSRKNGYSLAGVRKGYFVTKAGHKVKLLINGKQQAYLLVKRNDKPDFYYAGNRVADLFNWLTQ